MANSYLDKNGLLYLWQKIKEKFVQKEAGKGLSTNDYTTEEKQKLQGIENNANNYTLPTASAETLGGVKVGAGLRIDSGVLSVTGGGTADAVDWSNVQNKPNTVAGYGITDAYTKTEIDGKGFLTASDIANKADKATTLSGYGITDAYTKVETDGKLNQKANAADVYKKTETYNKEELDGKLSSVYKPAGSYAFESLPEPSQATVGSVYNVTNEFTSDERFLIPSKTYPVGTNVVVVFSESEYKFDVLAGFIDLSPFYKKTDLVPIENNEIDTIVT